MYCAFSDVTASTHCSEVVHFDASPTCLPIGWTLLRWVAETTVYAYYFGDGVYFGFSSVLAFLLAWFSVTLLYQTLPFLQKLPHIAVCSHCASSLLAYASTCTFATKLVPTFDISFLMISSIMPTPFKLLMNCSFKYLSNSLYLHSAVIILNLLSIVLHICCYGY